MSSAAAFIAGKVSNKLLQDAQNHTTLRDALNSETQLAVHGAHMLFDAVLEFAGFLLILLIGYAFLFLFLDGVTFTLKRHGIYTHTRSWIVHVTSIIIGFTTLILALSFLGVSLQYILGLGLLAFIISPGFATPASNAFQAVILNMTNEYPIGSTITINNVTGIVASINLQRMKLILDNGGVATIPPSYFGMYIATIEPKLPAKVPEQTNQTSLLSQTTSSTIPSNKIIQQKDLLYAALHKHSKMENAGVKK